MSAKMTVGVPEFLPHWFLDVGLRVFLGGERKNGSYARSGYCREFCWASGSWKIPPASRHVRSSQGPGSGRAAKAGRTHSRIHTQRFPS